MRKLFHLKIFIIILFFPLFVSAADLYFDPSEVEIGPNSVFAVDLLIDVNDCVNVVKGNIGFDRGTLKLLDFINGVSMLDLWVERPTEFDIKNINQEGKLTFSGGIPGGYCGKIPGDPGRSNIVARLIFETLGQDNLIEESLISEIKVLSGTRVLLNDGLGTKDDLKTINGKIKIVKSLLPVNTAWKDEINADTIPPEPFVIELHSNPKIYDGKYYIVFNTKDKQTGVDYYEVLEKRPNEEVGQVKKRELLHYVGLKQDIVGWKRAKTPYLLEDQLLRSIIKVRAVDKAGNERMVEYIPDLTKVKKDTKAFYIGFFVLLLLIIILSILKIIKRRKKNYYEENNKEDLI